MKSRIVRVRLKDQEWEQMQQMCDSAERGKLNASELIRLLLLREWKRRTTGKSAVANNEIASDMRSGRPRSIGE
jgi:hypothetical protein